MDGFTKRREEKKQQILSAARNLFDKKGFKSVNVKDIAAEAGVSHVSIYNFYENKENLAMEVIKTMIDNSITRTRALLDRDISFPEKLEELINIKMDGASSFQGDFIKDYVSKNPQIISYFNEIQSVIDDLANNFYNTGRDAGIIRKDIENREILIFQDIFFDGLKSHMEIFEDKELTQRLMKIFFNSFCY